MLLLVSGATKFPRSDRVGHLIVPKAWNDPAKLDLRPRQWAIDNGAFSGFDAGAFVRMLEAYQPYQGGQGYQGCLFATAPDVVGDAASTLQRWPFWRRLIQGLGFPPAFVAQDGIEPDRVPWSEMAALFIGGTTAFKESPRALALIAYAKARGIWAHVGRVNGRRRYTLMLQAGADSIDGSSFSMYPDTNIPLVAQWRAAARSTALPDVDDPYEAIR